MRYDKIEIRSWKDKPHTRSEATERELRELAAREESKRRQLAGLQERIDLLDDAPPELLAQKKLLGEELFAMVERRQALARAEEEAAIAAQEASRRHAMVGKTGYQVIKGTNVVAVVDERGKPFPEQAHYSYGVIQPNAPPPAWAKEEAAI